MLRMEAKARTAEVPNLTVSRGSCSEVEEPGASVGWPG